MNAKPFFDQVPLILNQNSYTVITVLYFKSHSQMLCGKMQNKKSTSTQNRTYEIYIAGADKSMTQTLHSIS